MNYPKLPSFRLDGKRALVTGAGRGIGMGASIALAESGANVTLVSRTEKELKDLTDHINSQGFKASYEVLDVNNEDEVSNFINNTEPFDILINNAGTNRPAKLIDTKIEGKKSKPTLFKDETKKKKFGIRNCTIKTAM